MKARTASLMLAFTLGALLLQPFAAGPAFACTCTPPATAGEYWDGAAVIVAGTVTELQVVPPFDPENPSGPYQVQFDFTVNEYLKGSGANTLALDSHDLRVNSDGKIYGGGDAFCEIVHSDSVGVRFVFFFGGSPTADPGYCNGSRALNSFEDPYLEEIRAGLSQTPTPTPTAQQQTGSQTPTFQQHTGSDTQTAAVNLSGFPQTGGNSSTGSEGWTLVGAVAVLATLAAGGAWLAAKG
ncbi:MAG TPA: hypothetical protein VMR52_02640 [Dehalococcoidia bacterium]|nr:hypothetical protein [Dehalococcoidia bacterium]